MNNAKIEIYKSKRGLKRRTQWRWRYVAPNGKRLAASGEGYANMADLQRALEEVTGIIVRHSLTNDTISRSAIGLGGRVIDIVVIR